MAYLLVESEGVDLSDVRELEGLHELHGHDAGRGQVVVHVRGPHPGRALELLPEPLGVLRLVQVVDLLVQQPRRLNNRAIASFIHSFMELIFKWC